MYLSNSATLRPYPKLETNKKKRIENIIVLVMIAYAMLKAHKISLKEDNVKSRYR